MDFTVWAPLRQRVRVVVDGTEHEMTQTGGWWCATVPDAGPGTDYAFLLDDDDTLLPDPRRGGSRTACTGVAGLRPATPSSGPTALGRPRRCRAA